MTEGGPGDLVNDAETSERTVANVHVSNYWDALREMADEGSKKEQDRKRKR